MAALYVSEHVVETDEEDSEDEFFSSNPSSEDESDAVDFKELSSNAIKVTNKSHDETRKVKVANRGWANAMAKVLRVNEAKVTAKKKSVILAKGKTDEEVAKKKRKQEEEERIKRTGFEIVAQDGKDGEEKSKSDPNDETKETEKEKTRKEIIREIAEKRLQKRKWKEYGRVKPDITAREKEKLFQRVATAGVVQLFNVVKQRQSNIKSSLQKAGSSEVNREKVMKSMTKGDFLDALKNVKCVEVPKAKQQKERMMKDIEATEKPAWNVLSDNYMMGAKMKDWGKKSESDDDAAPKNVLDSGDESSDN